MAPKAKAKKQGEKKFTQAELSNLIDQQPRNTLYALIGIAVYCYFFYIFLGYQAFFINLPKHMPEMKVYFPWSVDFGMDGTFSNTNEDRLKQNFVLLFVWGFFHSFCARAFYKKWVARILPVQLIRSFFCLQSAFLLHTMMRLWQPTNNEVLWGDLNAPIESYYGVLFGFLFTLCATFMYDHFDFFGLRQTMKLWKVKGFTDKYFYAVIRHPVAVGILIASWARPVWTPSSLLLAVFNTAYIMIGTSLEELDCLEHFPGYEEYQKRTGGFIPGVNMCPMRQRKAKTN